jgi:hypothetical protein
MWKIARKTEANLNCASDLIKRSELEEILCDVLSPLSQQAERSENEIGALRKIIGKLNDNVRSLNKRIEVLEEEKKELICEVGNLKHFMLFVYFYQCILSVLFGNRLKGLENRQNSVFEELGKVEAKAEKHMKKEVIMKDNAVSQSTEIVKAGKVPSFDPAWVANWKMMPFDGGTNLLEWADKFIDYISLMEGINEEQKLKILRFYLMGIAREYFDENRPTTLNEAITLLSKYFQSCAAKEMARDELNFHLIFSFCIFLLLLLLDMVMVSGDSLQLNLTISSAFLNSIRMYII